MSCGLRKFANAVVLPNDSLLQIGGLMPLPWNALRKPDEAPARDLPFAR